MKQIRNYYDKMVTIEYSQNIILGCVYRTYQLTTRKTSFKLEINSELTMKNYFLVDWVGDRAGIALLSPFSSLATVPYSMKNLTACFHFSSDV